MNKLIIVGASGHGKVLADIAELRGYSDISFLDDNPSVAYCGKYEVVGLCKDAINYKNADFIVAIGNNAIRRRIQTELTESGLRVVSLIHPNATISKSVTIGEGTVVMAGAVINPDAVIGKGCIINTCSSIDHDCTLGDFVHISVGAHIAGTVKIGDNTWVGIGATVNNNIDITNDCIIGAGAAVVKNLTKSATYIGVPAKKKD